MLDDRDFECYSINKRDSQGEGWINSTGHGFVDDLMLSMEVCIRPFTAVGFHDFDWENVTLEDMDKAFKSAGKAIRESLLQSKKERDHETGN